MNVERAWSNIDVYVQQRLDEMEALYAQLLTAFDKESEDFREIARLRSMVGNASNSNEANEKLRALNESSVFMRGFHFENYPQLKSLEQAYYTAERTSAIETDINAARRIYNNNVSQYNLSIKNFPTNVFSRLLGHEEALLFEAEPRAYKRPTMASEEYVNAKYKKKMEDLDQ